MHSVAATCQNSKMLLRIPHVLFLATISTGAYVLNTQVIFTPGQKATPLSNVSQAHSRQCLSHENDLPQSHSAFYGCRNSTDRLLFIANILKPARFFSIREKTIDYPGDSVPKGHVRNDQISAIWCYDLTGYKKGGYCNITGGGVNKTSVQLRLYQLERNKPLAFKVEIYGRTSGDSRALR